MAAEGCSPERPPWEGQTALGRCGVRVWSPCQGLNLCCFFFFFLVFNILALENKCVLQLNECLALLSSFANEQLCRPRR